MHFLKIVFIVTISVLWLCLRFNILAQDTDMPHGDDFNMDCELCHSTDDWRVKPGQISFFHNSTGFPLLGAHQSVFCRDCHTSLRFNHIATACADCHTDIHKAELGFSCENCHNTVSWENQREQYLQHLETNFPLIGAHAMLDCQSCHRNTQQGEFINISVECQACHLANFQQTYNPSHNKAGFDINCQDCHYVNSVSWSNTNYVHPISFALQAGHSDLDCIECHEQQYQGTDTQCYSCHRVDYERTTDPNHFTFGFPANCETCHNIESWERTIFDHVSASGFKLVGAHKEIFCTQCHLNNQITGLPQECSGCHQDDYNAVNDPDHLAGQFSDNCLDCHDQQSWSPSTFDHAQTSFPLTGAHLATSCADCHLKGQFAGLASDCWSCHENDFNQVTDPNHIVNNFDKNCTICHNTQAWSPATFDHNQTDFQLTGAHITVNCQECHTSGYQNTPTDCFACHQTDYESTSDPAHQTAGFPTSCNDCHNTSAWEPVNWDHDSQYFPIFSGRHQNAWDNCSECHVYTNNYQQFECIECHEHSDKNDLDAKHREEDGYQYNSQACYECHPLGRADDD